jgi:hypothetical protein
MDLATRSAWGDTAMNKLDVKLIAWRTDSSLRWPFDGAHVYCHGHTSVAKRPDSLRELLGKPRFRSLRDFHWAVVFGWSIYA